MIGHPVFNPQAHCENQGRLHDLILLHNPIGTSGITQVKRRAKHVHQRVALPFQGVSHRVNQGLLTHRMNNQNAIRFSRKRQERPTARRIKNSRTPFDVQRLIEGTAVAQHPPQPPRPTRMTRANTQGINQQRFRISPLHHVQQTIHPRFP